MSIKSLGLVKKSVFEKYESIIPTLSNLSNATFSYYLFPESLKCLGAIYPEAPIRAKFSFNIYFSCESFSKIYS